MEFILLSNLSSYLTLKTKNFFVLNCCGDEVTVAAAASAAARPSVLSVRAFPHSAACSSVNWLRSSGGQSSSVLVSSCCSSSSPDISPETVCSSASDMMELHSTCSNRITLILIRVGSHIERDSLSVLLFHRNRNLSETNCIHITIKPPGING